jgi:hypothetical protein
VQFVDADRINKRTVDDLYREGFNDADISRHLGVSYSWFKLWRKQVNYQRPLMNFPSNDEGNAALDYLVMTYMSDNPLIGEIMTWAYISSLGYHGKIASYIAMIMLSRV